MFNFGSIWIYCAFKQIKVKNIKNLHKSKEKT